MQSLYSSTPPGYGYEDQEQLRQQEGRKPDARDLCEEDIQHGLVLTLRLLLSHIGFTFYKTCTTTWFWFWGMRNVSAETERDERETPTEGRRSRGLKAGGILEVNLLLILRGSLEGDWRTDRLSHRVSHRLSDPRRRATWTCIVGLLVLGHGMEDAWRSLVGTCAKAAL